MSEKVPIPAPIWRQIVEFLKADKDGDILLRVRRGAVKRAEITQHIDANDSAV